MSSPIAHFVTDRRRETGCEIFISKMRGTEFWRTFGVFQLMYRASVLYVKVTVDVVFPRAGLANVSGS